MRRIVTALVIGGLASSIAFATSVAAQAPRPSPAPVPEATVAAETDLSDRASSGNLGSAREVIRIVGDYTLSAGDIVKSVVVLGGDATIEGRVLTDVVVVLGKVQLASTARVDGSLIVPGGSVGVDAGATVARDLFVLGGAYDAPPSFMPGGQQMVLGPGVIGGRIERVLPWITRGLLWGRPIVPGLSWVWAIVAFFFIVYLAIDIVFDRPVRFCSEKVAEAPLTTFTVGLLVVLLIGPVTLLLMVSIIGILAVPFVLCTVLVAGVLGKVGVIKHLGTRIVRPASDESRLLGLLAFVAGFAVLTIAYMIPALGFAAWATAWVFGLGSAALAAVAAYRRENPVPVLDPVLVNAASQRTQWTPAQSATAHNLDEGGHVGAAGREPGAGIDAERPVSTLDVAMFPHAVFRDRLAAFVLDIILVAVVQHWLDLTKWDSEFFLLLLAYHIGFWTWKGTTVGGIICQLRVVRVTGEPLRFADALVRGLSSIFSIAVVGLGCFWILKDPERQAWHDRIAGTYVVKVSRHYPL